MELLISLRIGIQRIKKTGNGSTPAEVPKYFFSSTGNDANDGLSEATPKQTLSALNALALEPGDFIGLQRGSSWDGSITLNYSGVSGNLVKIGAYGTGEKPKIYGSDIISGGWTLHAGNIYKKTGVAAINQLFVDGARMQVARYPETDYATVDSAPTTASLTHAALGGLNCDGAICHIHSSSYGLDKRTVTGSAGTTYTLNSAPFGDVTAGDKFIFVGKLAFLTKAGQWFYDTATSTLYVWTPNGDTPANYTIRGSVRDYGIYATGKNYFDIKNIEVLQQKIDGVYVHDSNYFNITLTDAIDCDAVGIHNYLGSHGTFEYNKVRGSNHYGIEVYSGTGNNQVNWNDVANIALPDNLGLSGIGAWYKGSGIFIQNGVTNAYTAGQINNAHNNRVDSVGYNGIHFANECVAEFNYITHCGYTKNDGGFIYTAGGPDAAHSGVNRNSIIRYNIGLYGHGIGSSPYFEGFYADEFSEGVTITDNTAGYVTRGIFLHNGKDHIVQRNTIYNAENGLYVSKDGEGSELTDNIVYGLLGQEVIHLNILTGTPVINNNKYINKYTSNPFELDWTNHFTFENWKATTGHDADSTFDNTALPSGYSQKLLVNPTSVVKTFYLNYATDVKNAVTGTDILEDFTVPAYSSMIVTGYGVTSIADSVVTYEIPIDFGFNSSIYGLVTATTTRRAMPIVMPENGMITSISFYHDGGTGNCLVGVYSNNGVVPNQRLAISAETALNVSAGWNTVNLINPVFVEAGTQVWLAVVPSIGGMHYEAGTPYRANATSSVYAHGLPMSFDDGSAVTVASYRQNIFCTYLKEGTPGD